MRKTYNSYKSYNSYCCAFRFPLTLLRRLFFLAARHSEQAPSALAPQRQFSVLRFPLSVFRSPLCLPLAYSLYFLAV